MSGVTCQSDECLNGRPVAKMECPSCHKLRMREPNGELSDPGLIKFGYALTGWG